MERLSAMTTEHIGRYEVEKRLGAGAMAVVYKAVDPLIGRTVAIKTIKIDSSIGIEQEELRQRFYREAKSAGNLNHPNIVTIYDIGEAGSVDYIAMEFVEGESLQEWIGKNPIPPLKQTLSIIEQVASGLDYAASHDIIHRDIKPANILLTLDMKAKIADFGIAKVSTSKFTQTGAVIGTPSYMSPEQAMGRTLDGRSDIFSLGVIFYEMLTGEKPFNGTNPSTIIYKILHEEPVQPQQLNVTLHPAFNDIVGRMLAKDPEKRYQNCTQLIQDLKNYSSMTVKASSAQAPATAVKKESKKSAPVRTTIIAFILIIAIAVIGYLYYQKSQKSALQQPVLLKAPSPVKPDSDKKVAAVANIPVKESVPDKKPIPTNRQTVEPENQPTAKKPAPVAAEPTQAEIRLEFSGANFPVTVYDGAVKLIELSASNPSIRIASGNHRFRLVSEEVYLNLNLNPVKLKTDEIYTIQAPALCSAFIDVPNDAYDGCRIHLDGRLLSAPYPAQIPKLAAGNHHIVFSWDSGDYADTKLESTFTTEANHHYRVRGEPSSEKVVVQQLR
jgi:serine/threonine protein kinase